MNENTNNPANPNPTLCPWIVTPFEGVTVLEGRAKLPAGYAPPAELCGHPVTWRRDDEADVWHFTIEAPIDTLDAASLMQSRVLDGHPHRFDRVEWVASPAIVTGDGVGCGEVETDDDGRPVAFVVNDTTADAETFEETDAAIAMVFGDALEVGPWQPSGPGAWRAEVVRWGPGSGGARTARSSKLGSDDAPDVCPWLTTAALGRMTIVGRVRLPKGEALPVPPADAAVSWTRDDAADLWRFTIELADTMPSAADTFLAIGWLDPHPHRFDRVEWAPPSRLAPHDTVYGADVEVGADGRPVAFVVPLGTDADDAAPAAASIRQVFGPALAIGPWRASLDRRELVAEVTAWQP